MHRERNRPYSELGRRLRRPAPLLLTLAILAAGVWLFTGPAMAGITDLVQLDYRWYQNTDAIQPTTALAAENTTTTNVTDGTVLRLRMNMEHPGTTLASGAVFTLQYGTSTSGPWTDVGGIASGATWRGADNASVTDGTEISSALISSSFGGSKQTYEESNDATTVNSIAKNKPAEFDWVVQSNDALASTTYYFRMVRSGGTALNSYTNYPRVVTAPASLTQQDYRWYDNANAVQPTTAQAAENTATTGVADTDIVRLRMNVGVADAALPPGETFKVQYATSTGGPWTDVGGLASGEIWRGSDNATPADGATLSAALLSSSEVVETYEEANSSAGTPNTIGVGEEGEWDWVVQNNSADASTVYYFRMVEGGGTALDTYTNYPQLTTAGPVLTQQDYRWYDNVDAIQPTTPQAAENTAITGVADTDALRLRMNVGVTDTTLASGETFKMQYATSTGGPWTDVGAIASGEIWRGLNNATPADGATLSTTTLSSSEVVETYEESNPSASTPNAIAVGQEGEWD